MGTNSKNFYTSDLHFNHHNLYVGGARTAFPCAQECQEAIRENFNKEIKPHDNLYILGDLTLNAKYEDLAEYLNSINGNKIVILGNHDHIKTLIRLKEDKVIVNWHPWKGCHDQGVPVFMTHFVPLEAHTGPEPRLYLHGHVHGMYQHIMCCPLRIDVGVDAMNFKPFSLDMVDTELINAIRLGNELCPNHENDMMCNVCRTFIVRSKLKRQQKESI